MAKALLNAAESEIGRGAFGPFDREVLSGFVEKKGGQEKRPSVNGPSHAVCRAMRVRQCLYQHLASIIMRSIDRLCGGSNVQV